MILVSLGSGGQFLGEFGQALLKVPGHPQAGILEEVGGVFLQDGQIPERIDPVQAARVDEGHEQVAHVGAMFGSIRLRVLPIIPSLGYAIGIYAKSAKHFE